MAKKSTSLISMGILGIVFAALTGFVFLNSFEVLCNRDISFVHALDRLRSVEIFQNITDGRAVETLLAEKTSEETGNFGLPKTMKIPVLGSRLPLSKAIFVNGEWLSRSNSGHFIITSPGKNGNIGNIVVYARSGWRTISSVNALKIGENIFLDTDAEWRYMFRITNKGVLRFGQPFIKSNTSLATLIFLLEDNEHETVFVFEGVFVSIQNIRQ